MSSHGKRTESAKLNHVQELEGLRGVAVALVVVFHSGAHTALPGGFLGVDIFFVLSGYLITSVLVREFDKTGSFDALSFYANRFLRLFPAMAAVCAALAVTALILPTPRQVLLDEIATLGHIANWTRALLAGAPLYLGHVWSLSIEEQFYLVWPALLILALRLWGRRRIFWIAATLAVAAASWRLGLALLSVSPDRLYNGFDTRADGLFVGCALALALSSREGVKSYYGHRVPAALWGGAILVLIALIVSLSSSSPITFIGGLTGANLCAAILVAGCVSQNKSLLKRGLSVRPLRYLGRISYSLYLWHYPIGMIPWFVFKVPMLWTAVIGMPVSIVVAALSHRWIETPALNFRASLTPRQSHAMGIVALAMTLGGMGAAALFFFGPH